MPKIIRALSALLAVLIVGFAVGACGGDDETTSSPPPASNGGSSDTGNLIQKDDANTGKTFTVGSKNFDEQYILGEIYAQALEAAGFTVKKELDLGSEQIAFKALTSGQIDAYPEYTGTALTSFYKVQTDDVPRDRDESFALLEEKLAADDITALPQTEWENTYKVAATQKTDDKYGNPKTLSELAEKAGSKATISGFPECRQRTDCLLGLKSKYDWTPKFISSQGQYADLDEGQAEFTFGFSTDGPLSTGKYVTYEDDKGLYPPYYVTFMVNAEGTQKLGDAGQELIAKVQEPLTGRVMQELNSRVSIDKEKPADVARAYLQEAGFIE